MANALRPTLLLAVRKELPTIDMKGFASWQTWHARVTAGAKCAIVPEQEVTPVFDLQRIPNLVLHSATRNSWIPDGGRRVSYTDRTLTCVDCGAQFTFSVEDQEYHASRGFTNEPKRCSTCRGARKSERDGGRS